MDKQGLNQMFSLSVTNNIQLRIDEKWSVSTNALYLLLSHSIQLRIVEEWSVSTNAWLVAKVLKEWEGIMPKKKKKFSSSVISQPITGRAG